MIPVSDGFTQEVYAKCDNEEDKGNVTSLNRFTLNGNKLPISNFDSRTASGTLCAAQSLLRIRCSLINSFAAAVFEFARARGNQMPAIARIIVARSMPRKGIRLRRLRNFQKSPE
jgi:hypothetical protein